MGVLVLVCVSETKRKKEQNRKERERDSYEKERGRGRKRQRGEERRESKIGFQREISEIISRRRERKTEKEKTNRREEMQKLRNFQWQEPRRRCHVKNCSSIIRSKINSYNVCYFPKKNL